MPGHHQLLNSPPTPFTSSSTSSLPGITSSSSQQTHQQQQAFAALAPESIFGWPALFTAIQSLVASLPIFRARHSGQRPSGVPAQSSQSRTQVATLSFPMQVPQASSAAAQASHPQTSSPDVNMTPVSPADGLQHTFHSQSTVVAANASNLENMEQSTDHTSSGVSHFPNQQIIPNAKNKGLALTALPDELIAMCYADLSAIDLVALEHVSRRLRHLIAYDSVCWKRCTESRWGYLTSNSVLLPAAARHAGTWKQLYSEKAICETEHAPWLTLCKSETMAIFDIIKAEDTAPESTVCWPMSMDDPVPSSPPKDTSSPIATASPVSVMTAGAPLSCLSVVLLIDASSSVTDDDFDAMKTFSRALVDNLRSTHPEAAVAVVQFNQHPKVEVSLTNVCKSKLSTSIENMEQLMGSTDIAAPIRRARQILVEDASPGDRAIVLLTDGQTHADELQESEREARKASEEVGARLYTLGVGRDIDEFGLGRVAAGSEGGMHFTLRRLVSSK